MTLRVEHAEGIRKYFAVVVGSWAGANRSAAVAARFLCAALALTSCAALDLAFGRGADPKPSALVAAVRSQYEAVLDGSGMVWTEQRWRQLDGSWRTLMRQTSFVVFDESRGQVTYKMDMDLPTGPGPRGRTKAEFFEETWRGPTRTDVEGSAFLSSSKNSALDAHPIHHSGVLPRSPLELLEAAASGSDLKIMDPERVDDLDCIVLAGQVYEGEEAYPIRFWLAEQRKFLPVKIELEYPEYAMEVVGKFTYSEPKPRTWLLSEAHSFFIGVGKPVREDVFLRDPDFRVNEGPHPDLETVSSLMADETIWDHPWIRKIQAARSDDDGPSDR